MIDAEAMQQAMEEGKKIAHILMAKGIPVNKDTVMAYCEGVNSVGKDIDRLNEKIDVLGKQIDKMGVRP